MINQKHKVFISYHHSNDQYYKNEITKKFDNKIFIDKSVNTGEISETLNDQQIRQIIRDEYLRDTTVTIVLVGSETKYRKHIDWEIYSSMYDGQINKKSGILVINLPMVGHYKQISISDNDKDVLGKDLKWTPIKDYSKYDYLPKRILDNIKKDGVKIAVVDYDRIINNPEGLKKLIDMAYNNRNNNNYDLSEPMRRRNG